MISNYFSINADFENANMWRFEDQQFRMGKSAFEDYKNYITNSPIAYVDKVTTPLLLWAGKKDGNVPYTQSVELHLAMRRANKKSIFLIYNDEQHTIEDDQNQIHLTSTIERWFAYYLKKEISTK